MAGTIARLNAAMTWDLNDFNRGTRDIEGAFGGIRNAAIGLSEAVTGAFRKMTIGISLPFAALAGFSIKAASDAKELQSAFNETFGDLSDGVNEWAITTGDALGRSTQTLQESSKKFQSILSKAFDPAVAAEFSKEFAVLAEDVDSFFNLRSGEGRDKIFSGLTGESEPLKQLGIIINETSLKQHALEVGIGNANGKLTEQEKIAARVSLIKLELAKADGDVIRTSDGLANQLRALNDQWRELRIEIGERLLPIAERVVGWARSVLTWFSQLPEGVKDAAVSFGIFLAALGPVSLALSTIAIIALPLFLARLNPVFLAISAIVNPIGTAVVALFRFAGGLSGIASIFSGGLLAALRGFAGILLRFFTGPIGLAVSAILFFKDEVVAALNTVFQRASEVLGPRIQTLFTKISDLVNVITSAFDRLVQSDFGQAIGELIGIVKELVQWLLEIGGSAVITVLGILIDWITTVIEVITALANFVIAVFTGEWQSAWDFAAQVAGNFFLRLASWIDGILPKIAKMLEIFGKDLGGDISVKVNPEISPIKQGSGITATARGSSVPSVNSSARRGSSINSGPSAQDLADRRQEIALQQELAVAREKGDLDAQRRLEREIALRDKVEGYARAGLSLSKARAAAERDILQLDQARLEAQAKSINAAERDFDIQLAQLTNDFELLKFSKDEAFLEERIVFWNQKGLDIDKAKLNAQADLRDIEVARLENYENLLIEQERERELELARLRGDSPAKIVALEEQLRIEERIAQLRAGGENGVGGLSEDEAEKIAFAESLERDKAELTGTFRETFRNGVRAALNGDLKGFFEGWLRESSFNALSNVLDKLADSLSNLLFNNQSGGGGGIFGAIASGIGSIFGGGSSSGSSFSFSDAPVPNNGAPITFNTGGSFKVAGLPGVDRNVLSLNGSPVARVSSGEILDVRQGNQGGGGGGGVVEVRLKSDMLETQIVTGAVRVVREAAPTLTDAAVSETFRRSGRPTL